MHPQQPTSYKVARTRAERLRNRMAQKKVNQHVAAYNKLVNAGIDLAKYWSLAAAIIPDHIKILSALLSFVDASYYSNKSRQAKTDAIGLALRAAYLYGKFDGQPPKQPSVMTAEEEDQEPGREPQENGTE